MSRTFSLVITCTVQAEDHEHAEAQLARLLPWAHIDLVDAALWRATAHDDNGALAHRLISEQVSA